jgi:hypothetical protein
LIACLLACLFVCLFIRFNFCSFFFSFLLLFILLSEFSGFALLVIFSFPSFRFSWFCILRPSLCSLPLCSLLYSLLFSSFPPDLSFFLCQLPSSLLAFGRCKPPSTPAISATMPMAPCPQ